MLKICKEYEMIRHTVTSNSRSLLPFLYIDQGVPERTICRESWVSPAKKFPLQMTMSVENFQFFRMLFRGPPKGPNFSLHFYQKMLVICTCFNLEYCKTVRDVQKNDTSQKPTIPYFPPLLYSYIVQKYFIQNFNMLF